MVFATNVAPWAAHEWPEVFATGPRIGPKAFIAFRFLSAVIFLGHGIAHLIWRLEEGDGWFYLIFLTHWALWLEVLSEILLLVLAIQGYRRLSEPRLSGLPTLVRVEMALYAIVLPTSLVVVALYWSLVTPIWDVVSGAMDPPIYVSIFAHLLNFLLLLFGLLISRLPYSIFRVGWVMLFGLTYVLWTIIHYVAQIGKVSCDNYALPQECPIYDAWDWNEPLIPTVITLGLLVVLPILALLFMGLIRCRDSCDPLLSSKRTPAPVVGENLEEGKTNDEKFGK